MKKILSFALVLVMVLSLFAGCINENVDKSGDSNGLAAAKEYLYTIYKDDPEITTADYDLVGVVAIDGVAYNVSWAVDAPQVSIVPGENVVTVDLPDASEVEFSYTLTATISDASGATETVSFTHKVPAVEIADVSEGDMIVLYNPGDAAYVTGIDYLYTSSSGSQKHELDLAEAKAEALPMAIQSNDNDTISFVAEGKYLYCDGTDVKFVAEQGEFTQFVLEPAEGGQYVRCATANYSGKPQYLEIYSGYLTCYSFNADKPNLYIFELQDAEGASGKVEAAAEPEKPENGAAVDPTDIEAVLNAAYALAPGAKLEGVYTLTGKIVSVDTAWSDQYKNITVTIAVEGYEDQPVMCYRLKGDGAQDLAVGDEITVTGELINYNGTIEYSAGCVLGDAAAYEEAGSSSSSNSGSTATAPSDPAEILDAAFALDVGEKLPYTCSLTGKVAGIDTYWSEKYQNISVLLQVPGHEDQTILCYRLKGDGAKDLFWGDTITVTGELMNYNGVVEFNSGCTVSDIIPGSRIPASANSNTPQIMDDLAALPGNATMEYESQLTGYVTSIDTPYSEQYHNVTVTMKVPGYEDQPIQCYRLKGDDAADIERGDTITVEGYLADYNGKKQYDQGCVLVELVKGDGTVPGETVFDSVEDILKGAYALEPGQTLDGVHTLTGVITSVPTEYSDQFKNVSVVIVVDDYTEYPILCYRLKGEGADVIAVGDTVTVTGTIINYNGTVEFNSGCTLDAYTKGEGTDEPEEPEVPEEPIVTPTTPAEILKAAYALEVGDSLEGTYTLTGVITEVGTAYSSQFKNVTVTIVVDGLSEYPMVCYRLKGEGADVIEVGDTITVTGNIKNYNGTVEFDAGCTLDAYTKGEGTEEPEESEILTTPEEILKAAYALEVGDSLEGTYTLTGVITEVGTAYSSQFKNVTVTIVVDGLSEYPMVCYRLKGEGADLIGSDDTITVTGTITNYNGTIEFVSGCTLDAYVLAESEDEVLDTPAKIIAAAYALDQGKSLEKAYTLTGVITEIDTLFSSEYNNVSVVIVVDGDDAHPILCYRLKGNGADVIAVGDTITVTGTLTNYGGTIEFKSGCTLDAYTKP